MTTRNGAPLAPDTAYSRISAGTASAMDNDDDHDDVRDLWRWRGRSAVRDRDGARDVHGDVPPASTWWCSLRRRRPCCEWLEQRDAGSVSTKTCPGVGSGGGGNRKSSSPSDSGAFRKYGSKNIYKQTPKLDIGSRSIIMIQGSFCKYSGDAPRADDEPTPPPAATSASAVRPTHRHPIRRRRDAPAAQALEAGRRQPPMRAASPLPSAQHAGSADIAWPHDAVRSHAATLRTLLLG